MILKLESTNYKKVNLIEHYQNSEQFRNIQEQLKPIADSAAMGSRRRGKTPSYATGFFWQVSFYSAKTIGSY